jgi:hypothetical protein
MNNDQDPSGDYGYDMAHEAMGTSQVPDRRTHHEHHGPPPAGGKADLDEDFNYDEAHDM